MPVVSMMRFTGDSDELAARVREHVKPVSERLAPRHGGLGTIVARTPNGIVVINLWESEDGRDAMSAEPEIQQAVAAAQLPRPDVEGFEVLDLRILESAVAARA
jgi:hypothetical protein